MWLQLHLSCLTCHQLICIELFITYFLVNLFDFTILNLVEHVIKLSIALRRKLCFYLKSSVFVLWLFQNLLAHLLRTKSHSIIEIPWRWLLSIFRCFFTFSLFIWCDCSAVRRGQEWRNITLSQPFFKYRLLFRRHHRFACLCEIWIT